MRLCGETLLLSQCSSETHEQEHYKLVVLRKTMHLYTICVHQKIPEIPEHTTLQLHFFETPGHTTLQLAILTLLRKPLPTPHTPCSYSHPLCHQATQKPWLIVKISSIASLLCFLWPSYLTRPAECSSWSFLSGIPVHNPENASKTVVLSLLPPVSSYTSKQRTPHSVIQV